MADEKLPLCALLSHVLVALTVEIDNAYESRAPHHTTRLGGSGPWLASYGTWANFLRLVPTHGTTVRELAARAGCGKPPHPAQSGMTRWGYVRIAPHPDDTQALPAKSEWLVVPTGAGRRAASIWEGLPVEMEARWVTRFGATLVAHARDCAARVAGVLDLTLPAYLPQLGWPLFTRAPASGQTMAGERGLVTALANALHAFAIDFEAEPPAGLVATANVLRVVDERGVRVRDIPDRTGVATAGTTWATGVLEKRGCVTVEPDPNARRGQVVRLTSDGAKIQSEYAPRADAIEARWQARFGEVVIGLRSSLEEIVGLDGGARLRSGMVAPEGCWRVAATPPDVLPAFPVVLHRGNYPDGS